MNLAIIVPLFNPCGYEQQRINSQQFFTSLLSRISVFRLFVTEADFHGPEKNAGDENFMWQKEALINRAIRELPPELDAVAWVDADLLFQNPTWFAQTIVALHEYPVVQMFERIIYLGPDGRQQSRGYSTAAAGDRLGFRACGGAIACRRDILDNANGIYDRHVLGGGDEIFMEACIGRASRFTHKLNPSFRDHVMDWCLRFGQHDVGFVPGTVSHLWHGDRAGRQYKERHATLAQHDFDPGIDVRLSSNGLLQWCTDKPELHATVRSYFENRNEDGHTSPHPRCQTDTLPARFTQTSSRGAESCPDE